MSSGAPETSIAEHDPAFRPAALTVSRGLGGEVLRAKRPDVRTARTVVPGYGGVVVRLWDRGAIRARMSDALRGHPSEREWRALGVLHREGLAPRPLWKGVLRDAPHTEALIMEDLGPTVRGSDRLRQLAGEGGVALAEFEDAILRATVVMVRAGLLDIDHTLTNFIVPADGMPRRVDLELAMQRSPARSLERAGPMVGRLLGTYLFAVQPDVSRAERFSARVWDALRAPRATQVRAQGMVDQMLARQRQEIGVGMTARVTSNPA